MNFTFLVPDIHDRPTGGNIYNRRMIAELQQHVSVDVTPWAPDSDPNPEPMPATNDVVIVDSLLLQVPGAIRSLREACDEASMVLLAHYLHCIDPSETDTLQASDERSLLPLFDGAITTSRFAKRALAHEGLSSGPIGVVPPGLDATYREGVPERSASDPAELLTVANLLPGKGLISFVDGLTDLDDFAWQWTLVGDDSLDADFASRLRTRIRDSRIAERVTVTGTVAPSNLRSRYDNADVFVLPSRFETCSMSTREAMARGLPVVAYDVGGIPENFGEMTSELLADTKDPSALGRAVHKLLTNEDERSRLGAAAREQSQTFPSWPVVADRLHSFLRDLE